MANFTGVSKRGLTMKCPRCQMVLARRPQGVFYCENKHCNIGVVTVDFKDLLKEIKTL